MSTEPAAAPQGSSAPGAYGLAVSSEAGIPGLDAPSGAVGGRRVTHRLVDADALLAQAGGDSTEVRQEGEGAQRVEYHEHVSGAVLIRTASFGDHLITDDGRSILSSVAGSELERWQRFFVGLVLPLAASVQGLEIFHAGAVATGTGVIALAGPSGAGKSSLVGALVAGGAGQFFADDVLAVDPSTPAPIAFPGTGLIGIPHERAGDLAGTTPGRGVWVEDDRKAITRVNGQRRPQPVVGLFCLVPEPEGDGIRFQPCSAGLLMGTTFDGLSRRPERLSRLLGAAAALADAGAEGLHYPRGSDPGLVAAALLDRLGLPVPESNGA